MMGCDRCGAQALAMETTCPVCGAGLKGPSGAGRGQAGQALHIPVRRHGKMPPPPAEILALPGERAAISLMPLLLGALGASLIAGGLGYWLW